MEVSIHSPLSDPGPCLLPLLSALAVSAGGATDGVGCRQDQLMTQLLDRDFHAYVEHLGFEAA